MIELSARYLYTRADSVFLSPLRLAANLSHSVHAIDRHHQATCASLACPLLRHCAQFASHEFHRLGGD